MGDDIYAPGENEIRERLHVVTEEANELADDVEHLAERVENALRQLDSNRHYDLWSSFCESRGDLQEAKNLLGGLNHPFSKLHLIFAKVSGKPALSEHERVHLLLEAENVVELAEELLGEARERYDAALVPDPDDLPQGLD